MLSMPFKNFIFFLILLCVCCGDIHAQSTPNSNIQNSSIQDTFFYEIVLTEDGISAVDTSGNDWLFDFELDMFVQGLLERSTPTQDELEIIEPVDTRCVVEKIIKTSSTKSVVIETDEYVDHDIYVFGQVTVKGWVKGNITSYKNRVIVKSTGHVDGNINASKVILKDGSVVLGVVNEDILNFPSIPADLSEIGFQVILIIMSIICLCIFLVVSLVPQKLEVVSNCLQTYKTRSTLLGFLFILLSAPIIGLLAITIIGIPIAVLGVPFAYLLAIIYGIASFSISLGNLVFGRFLSAGKKLYMKSFLGFALFAICWIIGISLLNDPTDSGIGVFFFVVSILLSIVPVLGGIGASVFTRFGYRPYLSWKDRVAENPQIITPVPPPIPKAPIIKSPPNKTDNT